jgi:K+-transporting ATPase ATPase C chain
MSTPTTPITPTLAAPTAQPLWAVARPALVLFAALSLLTGVLYPLAVSAIARLAFAPQAEGSLLWRGGQPVGSALIGQQFTDPAHFWGRPSATTPMAYNAANSGGANLGPLNPALTEAVAARIAALRAAARAGLAAGQAPTPGDDVPVPIDLVTTSASGLDPHISLAGAQWQAPRVARLRGLPLATVQALIDAHTEGRWAGWLGEPRVNVLALNLALDSRQP